MEKSLKVRANIFLDNNNLSLTKTIHKAFPNMHLSQDSS